MHAQPTSFNWIEIERQREIEIEIEIEIEPFLALPCVQVRPQIVFMCVHFVHVFTCAQVTQVFNMCSLCSLCSRCSHCVQSVHKHGRVHKKGGNNLCI